MRAAAASAAVTLFFSLGLDAPLAHGQMSLGPPAMRPGIAHGHGSAPGWRNGGGSSWTWRGDRFSRNGGFRNRFGPIGGGFWYSLANDAEGALKHYTYNYMVIAGHELATQVANSMTQFDPGLILDTMRAMKATGIDELFTFLTGENMTALNLATLLTAVPLYILYEIAFGGLPFAGLDPGPGATATPGTQPRLSPYYNAIFRESGGRCQSNVYHNIQKQ